MTETLVQQHLKVPLLTLSSTTPVSAISEQLDKLDRCAISHVCWFALRQTPEVFFTIAYTAHALLVKFYIAEKSHQAIYKQSNDPVFKDSCAEFFIAIDESGYYYNFEFNSLGTCLASYGSSRHNRQKLSNSIIQCIERQVEWKVNQPHASQYQWALTFILPPEVFCFDGIRRFEPANYKANFYKCGDNLPEPHYLAWNPVLSKVPDYHQPAYFGNIELQ